MNESAPDTDIADFELILVDNDVFAAKFNFLIEISIGLGSFWFKTNFIINNNY